MVDQQISCDPGRNSRGIQIPPEVLGKIYLENLLPRYPEEKGSLYPPMAVSKSWRKAALSQPRLWIHVSINDPSDLQKCSPGSLQTWLSRSKPHLLDVVLWLRQPELEEVYGMLRPKDARLFAPIMKVLFAQAYRWGNLQVMADDWQYSHLFQVLDRATKLRSVLLGDFRYDQKRTGMDGLYQPWEPSNPPRVLLSSLTRLTFNFKSMRIASLPAFDLPNLTELFFYHFRGGVVDLIRMMSGMLRLALLVFDRQSGVPHARTPVDDTDIFNGLENLTVKDNSANYSFLPILSGHCPNLCKVTLHYMFCQDLPQSPINSLTDVTLILEHDNIKNYGLVADSEAHSALLFCPNARSLTLSWWPDCAENPLSFDPFIKALACRGNVGVLSKLEHLSLQYAVMRMSCLSETLEVRSHSMFKRLRNDEPFYLTLWGCFGLPNVDRGTVLEVKLLFADPPEINMTFGSPHDPYSLDTNQCYH